MSRYLWVSLVAALVFAVAGCKGSRGSGDKSSRDVKYRDVVAKCVRLMAVDFDAAKDSYAALAGWQSPPAGARCIDHASKAGTVRVTISKPAEKKAEHEFTNLGLAVFVELSGEKKFLRVARETVANRLVPLRDLDAAMGKSVKGFLADVAAVKARHSELAGFSAGAFKAGRLDYSSGGLNLTVWADLEPEKSGDVQCFPLCARVGGGSSAARKDVLALLRKNLEPLRELERRTGGWQAR